MIRFRKSVSIKTIKRRVIKLTVALVRDHPEKLPLEAQIEITDPSGGIHNMLFVIARQKEDERGYL